jgi:flagellar hook-length control protein FliK
LEAVDAARSSQGNDQASIQEWNREISSSSHAGPERFPPALKTQQAADLRAGLPSRGAEPAGPGSGGPGRPLAEALARVSIVHAAAAVDPGAQHAAGGDAGGGEAARQGNPGGSFFVSHDTPRGNELPGSRPGGAAANQPQAAGNPQEAARLVRGASIEIGSEVQRMSVLLEDDRLGRIALRMVDRGGLIHAVVRTEGTTAARLMSESLPALLESLSQRGLLASWTSAQGEGQDAQDGSRQGSAQRQRGGRGSSPGGRRPARSAEAVFELEAG